MRYWEMYPAKLRLYRAILNTPNEELRPNEVKIGALLATDKDLQHIFDKAERIKTMKLVISDLIEEEGKNDNKI